ncbi:YkuS family protein [Alkalibaculum sporogenes]|uniref:YkuS family protein n=1 Tax=Alkalibaculum sporogenes TaxID=2655001 RepID=UPI00187B63EA|nr:YkuS family protein [Alkalibaculum sporogenes]
MILAIDKSHKNISEELIKKGYHITSPDSKEKVDAVLYHSGYEKGILENINNSSLMNSANTSGVLLIDIKNKNAKDVDEILKKRLYSPLF